VLPVMHVRNAMKCVVRALALEKPRECAVKAARREFSAPASSGHCDSFSRALAIRFANDARVSRSAQNSAKSREWWQQLELDGT
jgi:hypothetical protein